MEKNKALECLIHISNCNLGFVPSTPSEFNELSIRIANKTGKSISTSSIKRIWGYVKYDCFPSKTTLNILARYNDFKNWEVFLKEIVPDTTASDAASSFIEEEVVNANTLTIGDILTLKWAGYKQCTIEYISYLRFKVLKCRNIKLQENDTFTLHSICRGMPLFVSNILRGGIEIPAYIGAKKGGIKNISMDRICERKLLQSS